MFLTNVWPWYKVKVIKPTMTITYNDNVEPEQGYNHVKFERACFNGVWEKANLKVSSNEEFCQLFSLNAHGSRVKRRRKKSGIFMI